jgi:hypothetical protein
MQAIDPNYGRTWMFFPDDTGTPHIIELTSPESNVKFTMVHDDPDSKVSFWLYNK